MTFNPFVILCLSPRLTHLEFCFLPYLKHFSPNFFFSLNTQEVFMPHVKLSLEPLLTVSFSISCLKPLLSPNSHLTFAWLCLPLFSAAPLFSKIKPLAPALHNTCDPHLSPTQTCPPCHFSSVSDLRCHSCTSQLCF